MSILSTINLTGLEWCVLAAFTRDDHVGDRGWKDPDSGAWSEGFHDQVEGMDAKSLPGVVSSLVKKNLVYTVGEGHDGWFGLTDDGRAKVEENLKASIRVLLMDIEEKYNVIVGVTFPTSSPEFSLSPNNDDEDWELFSGDNCRKEILEKIKAAPILPMFYPKFGSVI